MLKLATISLISSALSALATFHVATAPVVAEDRCHVHGYRACIVISGVSLPETSDPKLRAELTRFVRQTSKDRL